MYARCKKRAYSSQRRLIKTNYLYDQCVLDVPCCFFAEELALAYPEAKIILNVRDVEKWYTSMSGTLFQIFRWPSWHILRYTDPSFCGAWCRHNEVIWDFFCDGEYDEEVKCKEGFERHNEYVRKVVPPERLLEYEIGQGWKPVTDFLGLEGFEGEVKRFDARECIEGHYWVRRKCVRNSVVNMTRVGVLVGVCVVGIKYAGPFIRR